MTDPLLRLMPKRKSANDRAEVFRRTVAFCRWMMDNETATAAEVEQRFGIHNSTAHRWISAWRASGNAWGNG